MKSNNNTLFHPAQPSNHSRKCTAAENKRASTLRSIEAIKEQIKLRKEFEL